jgi:hypothetical protein
LGRCHRGLLSKRMRVRAWEPRACVGLRALGVGRGEIVEGSLNSRAGEFTPSIGDIGGWEEPMVGECDSI